MDPENLADRPVPHWDLYRRDQFMLAPAGQHPPFNTLPSELEKRAKETLSEGGWLYASSNAGLGKTHEANLEAFGQWRIVPRMLVDTNARDTSIELFGHKVCLEGWSAMDGSYGESV